MIYLYSFIAVVVIGVAIKEKSGRWRTAGNAGIRGYQVVVDGEQVKSRGQVLGPLAGARAELMDATSRRPLTRAVYVAGALTKKTKAVVRVTCATGEYRQSTVDGAAAVRRAQAWVIRFNAIAAAAVPAFDDTGPSLPRPGGPAVPPSARAFGPEFASRQKRLRKWLAEHPRQDPWDD
jgi:hypothetical protein